MANKIQLRRDTTTNWENVNPILADGEPGLDITTNQVKYGDGANAWVDLSYASGGLTGVDGLVTFPGDLLIGTLWPNNPIGMMGEDKESVVWAKDDTEYLGLWWGGDQIYPENNYGPVAGIMIGAYDGMTDDFTSNASPEFTNITIAINDSVGERLKWVFDRDGNLTIPATGDIVRDGTSIFASSTALPVVTITNANFNQRDNPLPPATSTSEGAVVFTVTSPVALTATGLLLISGSNNKGGTIVTGGTTTGSQTLAFDMGGLNSTFTVVAFATTANGTSYSAPAGGHGGYVCFPAGTMITLSNGTKKAIEDIIYSDDLLVWDFDQGAYASAKPIWIKASETASEYNLLTFSDGSVLKTVGNHHIFNKHAERFTHTMTADTPIGTVSFNEYGEEISLVSAEVVKETVEFYNVWTEYHLNMFAEGVLTSNRFNNTYPIVGMKFAKGNKELRPMTEFNGLDPKWIHGLRLQEQTAEHTAEYIKWYVSERLEKLSIDSTQLA